MRRLQPGKCASHVLFDYAALPGLDTRDDERGPLARLLGALHRVQFKLRRDGIPESWDEVAGAGK